MKRIPIFEVKDGVPPENIKGVALNPHAGLLYVTTPRRMAALDLHTERVVWNRDFSLDGRYAYPSTGDIIDAKTRQIVGGLTDERGRAVQSEKMVEAVYSGGRLVGAAISSVSDGSADRILHEESRGDGGRQQPDAPRCMETPAYRSRSPRERLILW